ncbi:MAG TPA: 2-hydroxyacid dehydrogenase [Pseudomonadales bacterium]
MKVIYNYAAGPEFIDTLHALRTTGLDVEVCPESDDARLFELLRDADVLWHCLRPVDAKVFDAAPRLRLVQKIGVGVNTIDLERARSRAIAVCNMPGTNSRAVAELALGLMLAVLRQIRRFDGDLRRGDGWAWSEARQDRLGEIGGRTVGLVGMGGIPRLLAPMLTAMGAHVIYTAGGAKPELRYEFVDLDALLANADIVSLHVPLTDATRHMLNARRFARMRRSSVLINTARGALVDEAALLAALDSGVLAGAGLDVFDTEPIAHDNPLLRRDDVVLTPHIAWLTRETLQRSLDVAVANCHRLANAQPLLHRVV